MQLHDEDPYWNTIGRSREELESQFNSEDVPLTTILFRLFVIIAIVVITIYID